MKLQNELQTDDPRLLQYVLKEISALDLQVVETAMAKQPEIAAEIEELKNLYADISELQSSPKDLALSPERRKKLFADTIYKTNEDKSWLAQLSSFAKFRYATGGLVAATFAFLIFNQSLKHEVTGSKKISDSKMELAKIDQVSPATPTKPTGIEDLSRGGQLGAAQLNEIAEPKLAKKDMRREAPPPSESAPAEPPIETAMASDKSEMELAVPEEKGVQSDAIAADFADEKRVEGKASERRELQDPAIPTSQPQAAARTKTTESIGGAKMFAASKSGASVKSKNSMLSAFGSGGVALKGASQEIPFAVYITASGMKENSRVQLQAQLDLCRSKGSFSRELQFTFSVSTAQFTTRERQLTKSEIEFQDCVFQALKEMDKSLKTIQIDLRPGSVSK